MKYGPSLVRKHHDGTEHRTAKAVCVTLKLKLVIEYLFNPKPLQYPAFD